MRAGAEEQPEVARAERLGDAVRKQLMHIRNLGADYYIVLSGDQTKGPAWAGEVLAAVTTLAAPVQGCRNVALGNYMKSFGNMDPYVEGALKLARIATGRPGFVSAENSMGFHAPQESARILGLSIDASRKWQAALRKAG